MENNYQDYFIEVTYKELVTDCKNIYFYLKMYYS